MLPLAQSKKLNRLTSSIGIILGKLYYEKKQYAEAEKYLSLAKEIAFKTGEVEKIVEASVYAGKTALADNKKSDAYNNLVTAAAISNKYNLTKFNWESEYELGLYHFQNNQADSAIIYFKNAVDLQAVAKKVPLDRLLIETDSPYLAPVPYRGKINRPAYVKEVAQFIAHLRSTSFESIAEHSTRNFYQLFY